jgi:hypothetical protein
MKDLIKSKKFKTAVLGGLGVLIIKVAGLKGIVLDEATATALSEMVFGLATAYILAQGAADFGKAGKLLEGAKELAGSVSADEPLEDTADEIEPVTKAEAPAETPAEEAPKAE